MTRRRSGRLRRTTPLRRRFDAGRIKHADTREVAVAFGEIEAVADDELIGNFEADEISFELDLAAPDFIEQDTEEALMSSMGSL